MSGVRRHAGAVSAGVRLIPLQAARPDGGGPGAGGRPVPGAGGGVPGGGHGGDRDGV